MYITETLKKRNILLSRGTSVGVCSLAARVGTLLGVLATDNHGLSALPPAALAAAGLASAAAGAAIVLVLPEPAGKPLPEHRVNHCQGETSLSSS